MTRIGHREKRHRAPSNEPPHDGSLAGPTPWPDGAGTRWCRHVGLSYHRPIRSLGRRVRDTSGDPGAHQGALPDATGCGTHHVAGDRQHGRGRDELLDRPRACALRGRRAPRRGRERQRGLLRRPASRCPRRVRTAHLPDGRGKHGPRGNHGLGHVSRATSTCAGRWALRTCQSASRRSACGSACLATCPRSALRSFRSALSATAWCCRPYSIRPRSNGPGASPRLPSEAGPSPLIMITPESVALSNARGSSRACHHGSAEGPGSAASDPRLSVHWLALLSRSAQTR